MKKLRNAYGQCIGTRSITYDEQYKLALTAPRIQITFLIHTFGTKSLAPDVGKKKSGAKNSAFSKLAPKYCSGISRAKVWIKVCNPHSQSINRVKKRSRNSAAVFEK